MKRYVVCPAGGEFAVYDQEEGAEVSRHGSRAAAEEEADQMEVEASRTLVDRIASMYWEDGSIHRGYAFYGYVGHEERNYVTDAWVEEGAKELGWSEAELAEWMISKDGRFALESGVMSAAGMLEQMRSCDMADLMEEAFDDLNI